MTWNFVGLGEVLWDELPDGRRLGGAPANFAYHAHALGAHGHIISRLGRDEDGIQLAAAVRALGVGTEALSLDDTTPTSTVSVSLGSDGHPRYTIHEHVAWDHLVADATALSVAATADAICFGTLAQRSTPSREAIRRLVSATPPTALRIFDINLRQHYNSPVLIAESLALANVLKVNETELPHLQKEFGLAGDERRQLAALIGRHDLRAVAYTRGERGCLVYADGQWADLPGESVAVVDTVGAGDSFTAAFALGLLHHWPLDVIAQRASAIARFVCTQPGATPTLPAELRAPFTAS